MLLSLLRFVFFFFLFLGPGYVIAHWFGDKSSEKTIQKIPIYLIIGMSFYLLLAQMLSLFSGLGIFAFIFSCFVSAAFYKLGWPYFKADKWSFGFRPNFFFLSLLGSWSLLLFAFLMKSAANTAAYDAGLYYVQFIK